MSSSPHDDKVSNHIKPDWLKIRLPLDENFVEVARIARRGTLHTICESGRCPNRSECWSARTATLMILGDTCTRSCRFCATATGPGLPIDPSEPLQVAESIRQMRLKHAVVTSVTRDDLADGGAAHWAQTIRAIRELNPESSIEALIPDFDGREELLDIVIAARPDIIGHNIECVRRLTPQVRSRAQYERSMEVLKYVSASGIIAKSGLMVGLGETQEEVLTTMDDLRAAGVKILTIGQYLRPTLAHIAVSDYITPEQFEFYHAEGLRRGFSYVASAPLVRSSYLAHEALSGLRTPNTELRLRDLGMIDYREALEIQHEIFASDAQQLLLCEHPHVYTLGKNGREEHLLVSKPDVQLHRTDRGGQITYHGPGQIVGYPILDLNRLGVGLREYIALLEEIIIRTLRDLGIAATRCEGAAGVWLENPLRKICAIGVRASRGRVMHGFALNVNTDLSYFARINPCGFADRGVTSIERELGARQSMERVKEALLRHFDEIINNKIKIGNHVDPQAMAIAPPGRPRAGGTVGRRAGAFAGAREPAYPAGCEHATGSPPIL